MMGRNFSQRPSQLLQIEDELMAFDFDLACTLRLRSEDAEREKRQLEAMSGAGISNALGGNSQVTVDRSGPTTLNA